jgi:hypothetical protein
MTFLKAQGIRGLAGKNDWPRFTEEEPEIYEQEELDKLLAACDAEERLLAIAVWGRPALLRSIPIRCAC